MVIHTSTNKSPSKACFGYLLRSPLDVVYEHPNIEKNTRVGKTWMEKYDDQEKTL